MQVSKITEDRFMNSEVGMGKSEFGRGKSECGSRNAEEGKRKVRRWEKE